MVRRLRVVCCVVLVMGLAVCGCSSDGGVKEVTPPVASGPNQKVVSFKVTGMTCSNCEGHINKKLASLENVKEARASRKKDIVWLLVEGDAPERNVVATAVDEVAKAQGGDYKLVDQG